MSENNRAALILMDYANRRHLKIFACVEVLEAKDAPELIENLQKVAASALDER